MIKQNLTSEHVQDAAKALREALSNQLGKKTYGILYIVLSEEGTVVGHDIDEGCRNFLSIMNLVESAKAWGVGAVMGIVTGGCDGHPKKEF